MYERSVRTTLEVFEHFSPTPLNFSACSLHSDSERKFNDDSTYTSWRGEDEIKNAV